MMNHIVYEELKRILKMGKQVIVFVHTRQGTIKTAEALIELINADRANADLFECENMH
jgi:replicative superfamily II helicase